MAVDVVRVRNRTDHVIEGAFNANPYRIQPGGEVVMETEAAKKDFGDWDCRNLSKKEQRLRFRYNEYLRIRGQKGVLPGSKIPVLDEKGQPKFNESGVPEEILSDFVWKDRMDWVDIESLEGERYVTVLDDPEGDNLPKPDLEPDDKDLAIASLQSQIEKLNAAVVTMQEGQARAPVDSPENARTKAKQPKVVAAQSAGE